MENFLYQPGWVRAALSQLSLFGPGSAWAVLGEQILFGRVCSFRAGGCGFSWLSPFPSWLHTFLPVPTGCVPTGPTPEPLQGEGCTLNHCTKTCPASWGMWEASAVPVYASALPSMDPRTGGEEGGEALLVVPVAHTGGLTCAVVAGADTGTPITGLRDQQSSPTVSAADGEPSADSPLSLQHLAFHVSPEKPSISSEAVDGVVDSEPRMALPAGSQQRTKGCRRRRHKF